MSYGIWALFPKGKRSTRRLAPLTDRPSRPSMTEKVYSQRANRKLMNKTYYGYIRGSTARPGVRGVSLQERRAAIERFAVLGTILRRLARPTLADYGIAHALERPGHPRIPGTLAAAIRRIVDRGQGPRGGHAALGTLRTPRAAFA